MFELDVTWALMQPQCFMVHPQEYLAFLQNPKPGTDAFAALFPHALPGQEDAARISVIRWACHISWRHAVQSLL